MTAPHPDAGAQKLIDLAEEEWCALDTEAGREHEDGEDDAYAIGYRDGFERAVQLIDMLTGGDGEYRYCTNHDPERHCPTPVEMMCRIALRAQDQGERS